jgi:GNAT superfamily N-acetyltransferase
VTTAHGVTTADGAITVRRYREGDWPEIWRLMEPIVRSGETFSWDRDVTEEQARAFWLAAAPGATFVAQDGGGRIVGSAEMAPNHGGGGAHVANAGFMVDEMHGRKGVGRALGEHVIAQAAAAGFRAMVFNAVVATNERAIALWQSLGFQIIATVPEGFRHPTRGYVALHIMYRRLAADGAN